MNVASSWTLNDLLSIDKRNCLFEPLSMFAFPNTFDIITKQHELRLQIFSATQLGV